MKKCIVFGNCQRNAIIRYLMQSKSFKENYAIINTPAVHMCSRDGLSKEAVSACDLFIYQKVGEGYGKYLSTNHILSGLKDSCKKISIPNTFFKGYHPEFINNPVPRPNPRYGVHPGGKFPYGDKNIIKLLNNGKSKKEIIKALSEEGFYSYAFLKKNLEDTLNELAAREEDLDVKVTDFIRNNYRDKYLFYTVNHPGDYVSRFVSMAILKMLSFPEIEISAATVNFFGGHLHVPIYPSVIKNLQLSFISRDHCYSFYYCVDKRLITFEEYISEYIDYFTG